MQGLTPKQEHVLAFIRERILRASRAPTIREIAGRFGFSSTGTVRDYLGALQKKGFLRLSALKARAIELTDVACGIPVAGRVSAGPLQPALEDIESYLRPEDIVPLRTNPGDSVVFGLRVKGESMVGKGILEGDIVVVQRQPRADDGDIVVALFSDEATVKTLRRRKESGGKSHGSRGWVLEPANPKYRPIPCDEHTVIVGKVIRVIRSYV